MDDEKKIQENLQKVKDFPVLDRFARSFMKVHADRNLLADMVRDFEKQHNELYLLVVGLLIQLGKEVLIKRENWPALDFREYLIDWEDCPEDGGVKVRVKHFSEDS